MSTHTITAECKVKFRIPDMPADEREVAYPTLEITYTFTPGSPEVRYQRNGDPGWPADPAEVELVSAKLIKADGFTPTQEQINEWAEEWLWNEGYNAACDAAAEDRRPDPDLAYEQMRDDAAERRRDDHGDDF